MNTEKTMLKIEEELQSHDIDIAIMILREESMQKRNTSKEDLPSRFRSIVNTKPIHGRNELLCLIVCIPKTFFSIIK